MSYSTYRRWRGPRSLSEAIIFALVTYIARGDDNRKARLRVGKLHRVHVLERTIQWVRGFVSIAELKRLHEAGDGPGWDALVHADVQRVVDAQDVAKILQQRRLLRAKTAETMRERRSK
jgi:hypothetical protein